MVSIRIIARLPPDIRFSYLNANCELWTVLPSAVYSIDNFHCYVKHDDSGAASTETPHNVNDVLMAAGSLSGPFGVFNDGVCPANDGWVIVDDVQVCANAVEYLDAAVLEQESNADNPTGCYLDESTNKLVCVAILSCACLLSVSSVLCCAVRCFLLLAMFVGSHSGTFCTF